MTQITLADLLRGGRSISVGQEVIGKMHYASASSHEQDQSSRCLHRSRQLLLMKETMSGKVHFRAVPKMRADNYERNSQNHPGKTFFQGSF
jgi:hypothetical protein